MKTRIYVATHKKVDLSLPEYYELVQVGSSLSDSIGYTMDNSGESISKKNKNYCELTMLYWIWKNRHDDIIGTSHYRRFFFKKGIHPKLLDSETINKELNHHDAIVPCKYYFHFKNVYDEYNKDHYIDDFDKCRGIISDKYPEYLSSFDKISQGKKLYIFNMIICKKELFDNYCNWLFDILFELENQVDIDDRDNYQKRIYGFLSERLLNVWLEYNKIDVVEYPVYNIEESFLIQKIKRFIHSMLRWL